MLSLDTPNRRLLPEGAYHALAALKSHHAAVRADRAPSGQPRVDHLALADANGEMERHQPWTRYLLRALRLDRSIAGIAEADDAWMERVFARAQPMPAAPVSELPAT